MTLQLLRLSLLLTLPLSACTGRGEKLDSGEGDADTDADSDADSDADTDADVGFTVSGITFDVAAGVPGAAGLTVTIADPTPALAGGDVTALGSGTTDASGMYSVAGIETSSTVGLFQIVSGTGVMATATGIAPADYGTLVAGDILSDRTAYIVSTPMQQGIDASLTAAGYTGDSIVTAGLLVIAIRDADGAPVSGATVSCTACAGNVYYMDADSSDGLFTSAAGLNTGTSADASAFAMIPGGGITSYSAADGGVHDFQSQLGGSLPELAAFIAIYGTLN